MIATIWQLKWWLTAVGPNLVATAVCVVPTLALSVWRLERRLRSQHKKLHDAVMELHRRLDLAKMTLDDSGQVDGGPDGHRG